MKEDLISRQAAIDKLKINRLLFCDNTPESFAELEYGDKCRVDEIDTVIAEIVNMPYAQPERKTGRWKTAMLDHEAFGVRPTVLYCSQCHQCIAFPTRYCPNCGAKMEVEHD